jgi:hypothetical protein
MTDERTTAEELEEQAEESGYGAAEGETGDAPEQVLPTEVTGERDDRDDDDRDQPRP